MARSTVSPVVLTELAAFGRKLDARLPQHVIADEFEFVGVITDNALTEADLTAANACVNASFQQMFGTGADPSAILMIEELTLAFEMEGAADSLAIIADLFQTVYVRHQKGVRDVRQSMGRFAGTYHDAYAVADTSTAGAAQIRERVTRVARTYKLPEPWFVNMKADVFGVAPLVAVNTSGNIPFHLWAKGFAWREGEGDPVASSLADLGDAVARQRAAERAVRDQMMGSASGIRR